MADVLLPFRPVSETLIGVKSPHHQLHFQDPEGHHHVKVLQPHSQHFTGSADLQATRVNSNITRFFQIPLLTLDKFGEWERE